MSAKTERENIIRSGDPIARHSLNQRSMKYMRDRGEKFSGTDRKAAKAERRRWKQEQFLQDLPEFQFNRALEHIVDGTASEEDIDYVGRNIHGHEQAIETFRIRRSNGNGKERVTGVTITIVDFTRSPSKPLH